MRRQVREFVRICAEVLPLIQPIYEFGALRVPRQEDLANLRPLFPGKKYVGADMRVGPGVDVLLNLHQIALADHKVGTALMLETLEHVEFPRRAIYELYRVLNPDGILVMSSAMKFAIHNYPQDYWRFTPAAFESLLKPFDWQCVEYAGEARFPHTIVGVGGKGFVSPAIIKELRLGLEEWRG